MRKTKKVKDIFKNMPRQIYVQGDRHDPLRLPFTPINTTDPQDPVHPSLRSLTPTDPTISHGVPYTPRRRKRPTVKQRTSAQLPKIKFHEGNHSS